jgi:hypothetical protein
MSANRKRLLRSAVYGTLAAAVLLFLAHPYSRQSVFGPTVEGLPLCYWQDEFRAFVDRNAPPPSIARIYRWLGIDRRDQPWGVPEKASDRLIVLLSLADDPDAQVRMNVANLLSWAEFPPDKRDPAVIRLLQDHDPEVRTAAANCVRNIGRPGIQGAIPVLLPMLDDTDPAVKLAAAHALWHLSAKKAHEIVPILRQALRQPNPLTRHDAANVLAEIGTDAMDALAELAACAAADPAPFVRRKAITALKGLGGPGVPALMDALRDPDVITRILAMRALGSLGPTAQPAAAAVQALVNDPAPEVRIVAGEVLQRIDPEHHPAPTEDKD